METRQQADADTSIAVVPHCYEAWQPPAPDVNSMTMRPPSSPFIRTRTVSAGCRCGRSRSRNMSFVAKRRTCIHRMHP